MTQAAGKEKDTRQLAISIHLTPHRLSIASHTRIKAIEKQEKTRNPKACFQVRVMPSVAGWRINMNLKDTAVYATCETNVVTERRCLLDLH